MAGVEHSSALQRISRSPDIGGCRFCGHSLTHTFVDLGMSPLCESFVTAAQLNHMEPFYPLHVLVCENCLLVQLGEYVSPSEIFSEYAYFSSYSESWVRHAEQYAEAMIRRFGFGAGHQVMEIASNDGYLLQHFVGRGIRVLGIEPAANVAAVARGKGIPTVVRFFGSKRPRRLPQSTASLTCWLATTCWHMFLH